MQKVFFRPISHFNSEQATHILGEINPNPNQVSSQKFIPSSNPKIHSPNLNSSSAVRRQNRFVTSHPNPHSQQEIGSSKSIFNAYQQFQLDNNETEKLKEENSRLHYEKMALESTVQKLRQENSAKDQELSRLREIVESQKSTSRQSKQFFQGPVKSPQQQQVHFMSAFEPNKRVF